MIAVYILMLLFLNSAMVIYGYKRYFFVGVKGKVYLPSLETIDPIYDLGLWIFHIGIQIFSLFICVKNQYDILEGILFLTVVIFLFYIAIFDLIRKIIPNKVLLFFFGFRLTGWILNVCFNEEWNKKEFISQVVYTFIVFLTLLLIVMIAKGGFGFGDVKLLVVLSLYWEYSLLMSVVLMALIMALVISLYILAFRNGDRKDTIPFAPFIYIGFVINILFMI